MYLLLDLHLLFYFVELQILVIQQHHINHGIVSDPIGTKCEVIFDVQFLVCFDHLEDLALLFEGGTTSRMAAFHQLFRPVVAEAAVVECRILHTHVSVVAADPLLVRTLR